MGRQYQEIGEWESAVRAFNQACFFIDHGKNGCVKAGNLYLEHSEFQLAGKSFRNSIRQLSYWQPARDGLRKAAIGLYKQGDIDMAVSYLELLEEIGDVEAMEILDQITDIQ